MLTEKVVAKGLMADVIANGRHYYATNMELVRPFGHIPIENVSKLPISKQLAIETAQLRHFARKYPKNSIIFIDGDDPNLGLVATIIDVSPVKPSIVFQAIERTMEDVIALQRGMEKGSELWNRVERLIGSMKTKDTVWISFDVVAKGIRIPKYLIVVASRGIIMNHRDKIIVSEEYKEFRHMIGVSVMESAKAAFAKAETIGDIFKMKNEYLQSVEYSVISDGYRQNLNRIFNEELKKREAEEMKKNKKFAGKVFEKVAQTKNLKGEEEETEMKKNKKKFSNTKASEVVSQMTSDVVAEEVTQVVNESIEVKVGDVADSVVVEEVAQSVKTETMKSEEEVKMGKNRVIDAEFKVVEEVAQPVMETVKTVKEEVKVEKNQVIDGMNKKSAKMATEEAAQPVKTKKAKKAKEEKKAEKKRKLMEEIRKEMASQAAAQKVSEEEFVAQKTVLGAEMPAASADEVLKAEKAEDEKIELELEDAGWIGWGKEKCRMVVDHLKHVMYIAAANGAVYLIAKGAAIVLSGGAVGFGAVVEAVIAAVTSLQTWKEAGIIGALAGVAVTVVDVTVAAAKCVWSGIKSAWNWCCELFTGPEAETEYCFQ